MAKEVIITDDKLAEVLEKELLEKGGRGLSSTILGKNAFTEEELSRITKLDLKTNEITNLKGLENCVNLKELQIISPSLDEILEDSIEDNANNFLHGSEVLDLSVIENLNNLEKLTIKNNEFLTSIDLTTLRALKVLELENNINLLKLEGLENLRTLEEVSLLHNPIKNLPDLQLVIEESNLKRIELDMDTYPQLVEKNPELAVFLEEKQIEGSLSIEFKERTDSNNIREVPLSELKTFEEKTQIILANIIEFGYTDVEKIAAIYSYLTQNVMYAKEMEKTQNQTRITNLNKEERPELDIDDIQTYSALTKEEGNIRGYANLMHYMLRSLKIDSKVVNSRAYVETSGGEAVSSNSVIRARVGNDWFYFDPALDRERKGFENFYKTKDEFSFNHVLSGEEYNIKSPVSKGFTNFELTQMVGKVSRNIEMNEDSSKNLEKTSNSGDTKDISSQGNIVKNVSVPQKDTSNKESGKGKDINAGNHEVENPSLTPEQQKLKTEMDTAKEILEEEYKKGSITKEDVDEAYRTLEDTIRDRGVEGIDKDLERKIEENEDSVEIEDEIEDEIDDHSEGRIRES